MSRRRMPRQIPGRSKQDYGTEPALIKAIEARFGKLDIDLAGTEQNKKAPNVITPEIDSLVMAAARGWPYGKRLFLNPPFGHIAPWAVACALWAEELRPYHKPTPERTRLFFLTPASVGSNWFRDHVFGRALVLFLCSNEHGSGRITFEGEKDPYPKDCIISVFGAKPGYEMWGWRLP